MQQLRRVILNADSDRAESNAEVINAWEKLHLMPRSSNGNSGDLFIIKFILLRCSRTAEMVGTYGGERI